MSKTYRTIPNNEEVEKIINKKKIKRNEKKVLPKQQLYLISEKDTENSSGQVILGHS